MPRVIGGMHFLHDVGAQRRRNLQIKKRVVLSPSNDDKGDYLESGRGEPDDQKRLKQVFFDTFLQNSQKESGGNRDAPEVLSHSIFDNRDDSPTERIQTRGREKLMAVRADAEGKIVKRSILGSIDEFMKTTDQKNQVHTHSMSDETTRSMGKRAGVRRSVGSNISNNGLPAPSRPRGGNRLNFSVDMNVPGMSQPSGSQTGLFSDDGYG